jgi:hypothetical protein
MQLFPIQRAGLFFRASRRDHIPALARIVASIEAVLESRTHAQRTQDIVAARYKGQAWCDSTERQLTSDMLTKHTS